VVGHLEEARPQWFAAVDEIALHPAPDVPRQQARRPAPCEAQDERIVVVRSGSGARATLRVQDLDRAASHPDPHPAARAEHDGVRRRGRRFDPPHGGLGRIHRPEPQRARRHLLDDRHRPADVITVRVREGQKVDVQQPHGAQGGRDHARADVELAARHAAGVHQHRQAVGEPDQQRVALSHVEGGDLQTSRPG
jgi:hypothetical protein